MSVQTIVRSLEELTNIHEDLIDISKEKTELIKSGSPENLQKLLIKEQKYIHKLEQREQNRERAVFDWLEKEGMKTSTPITEIMEHISDKKIREKLEQITTKLTKAITDLKHQEQMNQSLLQQSVQFVQLSLNTMNPTLKNVNYDKKSSVSGERRSMFDSKA